ncbi:peroxiredoxin family protein [Halalkalibacter akibai]|uniref:Thioredoxin n=1 Tax=Halalkalibacter akibai (strain ATCC 43226 / DSM 21942 / CIP 109018 / JCM 9157 / 1139) TaxID=1236973 RepID=W4QRA3_HALA3|nr:TlpA disulfide reductase family protein [Halalkalibacter akibai]GAE34621.1 thioredoxin [Halalkalibacter akibai JCM 9157]
MKQAPMFSLPSQQDGSVWSLEKASSKITMITFWTSWCPDSQKDLLAKQKLFESLHSNEMEMVMIHVSGRDPDVNLSQFLGENHFTFPVLLDEGTKVYDRYHCMGVPTTVLVNTNKDIAFVYHDKSTIMDIMNGVASLLNE